MVFTESSYMFEWHENGVSCMLTPKEITILDAQWHPYGKSIALHGYNKAVLHQLDDS